MTPPPPHQVSQPIEDTSPPTSPEETRQSVLSTMSTSTISSLENEKHKGHQHRLTATTISSTITTSTSTYLDLEAQQRFPQTPTQKHLSFLRYTILTVYRRLFTLAFTANLTAFILLLATHGHGRTTTPLDLVNASSINLAICGLCRQPLVVNALFLLFGSIPRSAPIRLRRLACKIFHLGGVHSGTGVAACLWYVGFAVLYTIKFEPSAMGIAVLVLVWLVLAFLVAIVVVAHPGFRVRRHDWFELTHRFSNWIILVFFWALVVMLGSQEEDMGRFLVNLPAFWVLIVITVATIHPWLLLRRVKVTPEPLSAHAIRLHFDHTSVLFGQGISVAKHPLADWHSFASFTDRYDTPESKFSVLVSKAGDWTRAAIKDEPTYLWKRGVPTYGFGYVLRMFSRIIVVTTGSGIGPCLSFIGDDNRPLMRVLWQTRAPVKTYGARTMGLVRKMDPDPVILDTTSSGARIDMLPVVLRLYEEFGAEAVCVISNPKMTKKIVYGCELRGIPAYGPIFDS